MDQIGYRGGPRIRPGQATALATGDPDDAVLAHQPGHAVPANLDALTLEFARDALGAMGGVRRVNFSDQLSKPPVVVDTVTACRLGADPGTEAGGVGDQDPAQQSEAEPVSTGVDESEALSRRRAMNQRLRRPAQDLVLTQQVPVLKPAAAKLPAQLTGSGSEITIA
jgi:hypothetical protein